MSVCPRRTKEVYTKKKVVYAEVYTVHDILSNHETSTKYVSINHSKKS